jgi:hypothetical protein
MQNLRTHLTPVKVKGQAPGLRGRRPYVKMEKMGKMEKFSGNLNAATTYRTVAP